MRACPGQREGIPPLQRSAAKIPLLVMLAAAAAGAAGSPRGTARAVIGGATVEIDYGRPWVRGRDLLQWIEPGQLWRLGADAPTTIQSTARLGFGGMLAPPGKHILLVRYIAPGAWSLVISSRPAIEYVPAARIAEALAHFDQRKDPVEQFTIQILALNHHGAIDIAWGRYRLSVPFSIANR